MPKQLIGLSEGESRVNDKAHEMPALPKRNAFPVSSDLLRGPANTMETIGAEREIVDHENSPS